MKTVSRRVGVSIFLAVVLLNACGGGGGNGAVGYVPGNPQPKHAIGGSVTGLAVTGLVLQNNGGDDLSISGNGKFTFATSIQEGSNYSVSVKTQPTGQTCSAGKNTGTVAGADVTDVSIVCSWSAYTIGGNVHSLTGAGLVLQDNGGDDLTVSGNGAFTFATPVSSGAAYNVTVKTQPAGQTCSIISQSGTVSGGNVTTVDVTCSSSAYTIGGSVSGLSGAGLVLQNNSGDDKVISGNGAFTFAAPMADKTSYYVTVKTQPAGQTCLVTNSMGAVNGANISDVSVSCAASYTLYVDITGLTGSISIQNNGSGGLSSSSNGTKTLAAGVLDGSGYNVAVSSQPVNQTCIVSNGVGTVSGADVTDISVACATDTFTVGGTESGLGAGTLVLQNNGGDDLTISGLFFTFAGKIAIGDAYNVTVKTQPAGQTCTVSNGAGLMPAGNVTDVSVVCSGSSYSIGGLASGVTGTVVLQDNGGDDLTITGNGAFTFLTKAANNAGYSVTVKSSGSKQHCSVTNGSGAVSGANVTNVGLSCSAVPQHLAYASASGAIGAYPIDGTGGSLPSSPASTIGWNSGIAAITSNGKFMYITNGAAKTVSAYSIDAATGAMTSIASYPTGSTPRGVAIDPTSSYVYVANKSSNSISGFTINGMTGELTEISGSPFIAGTQPEWVSIDPAGTHVYVVNYGSSDISAYTIGGSGVLTPITGSPFKTGTSFGKQNPQALTVSADGNYAYIPDYWGNQILVFNLDGSGALTTEIAGSPFAAGTHPGTGAIFDPTGQFLYVSNEGSYGATAGTLSAYSVNTSTGALTQLAGSPYTVGQAPGKVFVDSTGRFVFVNGGSKIWAFTRDASTGQLTPAQGSPYLSNASLMAVTP